eukprot:TRINITY_DN3041_c0_g1_i1.p1 TRINITY_DN3041_c0_g1~~TRINITY_DN3041_c0_g1_i1.p1  ORF type:complete len:192 (-),score=42.92 TRINITY_DN3041_c0_g1_i1:55-630(-)
MSKNKGKGKLLKHEALLEDADLSDEEYDDNRVEEEYITHFLSPFDTLQGLSLKYDVPIQSIKRVNNITSEMMLKIKKSVLIPNVNSENYENVTPMIIKRKKNKPSFELIDNFKQKLNYNCSTKDATYYLENNNLDLVKALEMYNNNQKDNSLEYKKVSSDSGSNISIKAAKKVTKKQYKQFESLEDSMFGL